MADWSKFYADLRPHVPGCAEPMMDQALRRAAAEFFSKTFAWLEWLAPVVTVDGEREYALTIPAGAIVIRLEKATANGLETPILSYRSINTDIDSAPVDADGITTRDRLVFTLAKDVVAGTSIQVQATLAPGEDATGVSDAMFSQYVDDIVKGAKARLQGMPDKPFSRPDQAMLERSEFLAAIASKNVDAYRGYTGQTPRNRAKWV